MLGNISGRQMQMSNRYGRFAPVHGDAHGGVFKDALRPPLMMHPR